MAKPKKKKKKKKIHNGNRMEWKNKNPVVEAGAHSARTGSRKQWRGKASGIPGHL